MATKIKFFQDFILTDFSSEHLQYLIRSRYIDKEIDAIYPLAWLERRKHTFYHIKRFVSFLHKMSTILL